MVKRSGNWARVPYDPAPINLLHEWIGKRVGTNVQFLQTLSFNPATGLLGVYLPGAWGGGEVTSKEEVPQERATKMERVKGKEKKGQAKN